MSLFIVYLIEVSICLSLFYSVYFLFNDDTFYYLKRGYLLLSIITSLIIPQVSAPNLQVDIAPINRTDPVTRVVPVEKEQRVIYHDTFEKVTFGLIPEYILADNKNVFLPFFTLIGILYLTGFLYFSYRFLRNLFHVYLIYKRNRKEKYLNFNIVQLSNEYPTFSFFNCIFLNNKNLSDEDKGDVILHEIIHIKQKHSFDIIFIEVCRILLWFNPIIWFYKSSIVKVHECLADQFFVETKPDNLIDYQSLLLKQYLSKFHIELAHPFNYSLIKYRIKMMTKNKSKWWAKYKLLFALPIIFIGLAAFSNADLNHSNTTNNNADFFEPQPWGMIFIPQGSFILKRTDGNTTQKLEVSIAPFWMKETEVRVEEYAAYLESIKKDSTKLVYNAALPNMDKAPYKGYFKNEAYKAYPMVGISLVQAQNYCIWRTRKENQRLKSEGKHLVANYRIPTEAEWAFASFGGIKPEEFVKPVNPGLIEIKRGKSIKRDHNKFALIYMFSNVSEWTNTPFDSEGFINELQDIRGEDLDQVVVKGENYKKELMNDKLILSGKDSYEYVGFRYVRTYIGKP